MVQFISKKVVTVGRSKGITIPKPLIDSKLIDPKKPVRVTIENIDFNNDNAVSRVLSRDSGVARQAVMVFS